MTLWLHQGFLCHVCEQLEVRRADSERCCALHDVRAACSPRRVDRQVAAVLLEPQLDPAPVRKSQETAEVEVGS